MLKHIIVIQKTKTNQLSRTKGAREHEHDSLTGTLDLTGCVAALAMGFNTDGEDFDTLVDGWGRD